MGYMGGVEWESRRGADSLTRQLPTIPKGDKLEKDGGDYGSGGSDGSGGSCGNGGRAPEPPKGDKPEKDGGSCGSSGSCGSAEYSWKGSEKTQLFFLNSFSHFAIISASGIVFKKPLANKKLKLS